MQARVGAVAEALAPADPAPRLTCECGFPLSRCLSGVHTRQGELQVGTFPAPQGAELNWALLPPTLMGTPAPSALASSGHLH